ncbi:MAG: hypothetical protein ACKO7A_00700 [Microcystis sp.]
MRTPELQLTRWSGAKKLDKESDRGYASQISLTMPDSVEINNAILS